MRPRIFAPYLVLATLIAPAAASASFAHVVSAGESLSSIAAADGLTVEHLAAANAFSPDAQLVAGATIQIPAQAGGTSQSTGTTGSEMNQNTNAPGTPTSSYVVKPGDALSAIAATAGVSTASLAAANGLDPGGLLLSGSVLSIPGPSSAASSPPSMSPPLASLGGNPPYPTSEVVSASQIGQIAAANGVSPSLAEALAWQESGFNNNIVSSSDARGVMQILPSTWDWIGQNLTPHDPLAAASAIDNVRAGVLLLKSLLGSTGDATLAVAAYYQGLASVQRNGVLPATQQYVSDVMALAQRFGGA